MSDEIAVLGVVENTYVVSDDERTGWFRRRAVERTITFLDWTIDGRPLRELVADVDGRVPSEVTVLQNRGAAPGVGRDVLRLLLGRSVGDEFSIVMPDGRAPILLCSMCFDLECATLTAEVVWHDDRAEWRDVAWQVARDDLHLEDSDFEPTTIVFDRAQYESLIHGLLLNELEVADG